MKPSPGKPRELSVLAARGRVQSQIWYDEIRPSRPARAMLAWRSGSHQTWYVSTTTPTAFAGWSAAMSSDCLRVVRTPRSAVNRGCIGSRARRTPLSDANGTSSAILSATRCRAATRFLSVPSAGVWGMDISSYAAGSPPTTMTSSVVPRACLLYTSDAADEEDSVDL